MPRTRTSRAARSVTLPKSVQRWMCYTNAGEMRRAMFVQGGYTDTYKGWSVAWLSTEKQYMARPLESADRVWVLHSTRKADVYKMIDNLQEN